MDLLQLFLKVTLLQVTFSQILENMLFDLGNDLIHDTAESHRKIWFFKSSDTFAYAEALMNKLISTEPFVEHPKIVFNEFIDTRIECVGEPMLVVVLLGTDLHHLSGESGIGLQFEAISVQTKLIVIFPFDSLDRNYLQAVLGFFKFAHLNNILYFAFYIESNSYLMLNYILFQNQIQIITQYESSRQVFPKQINFDGHTISACTCQTGFFSMLDSTNGQPQGFDVQLVNLVFERMNGSLIINFVDCDYYENDLDCLLKHAKLDKCKFNFGRWILNDAEYGIPVQPMHKMVLVIPRGAPLNVYELLAAPYTSIVWKVATWVTFLGTILLPSVWKRSPISFLLLIVCGLNDSFLNRSKAVEKLVILGFITIVYLLLSAYEAKITSFLAEWPYHADITAIGDLQAANVQILTSSHFVPKSIIGDPRLQGLIQRTNISRLEELFKNTQRIGFVIEYHTAQIILQKQLNFDHKTSRAYFVMMEEHLSSDLVFFYLGNRNPTRTRFAQLQQRVYESGIDLHWTRMFTASGSIQQTDLVEQPPKMIPFEQLWHLKLIFLSLWSCSLLVFVLEMSFLQVQKRVIYKIRQCKVKAKLWTFIKKFKLNPAKKIKLFERVK